MKHIHGIDLPFSNIDFERTLTQDVNRIFGSEQTNTKELYFALYKELPISHHIHELDLKKLVVVFKEKYKELILHTIYDAHFSYKKKEIKKSEQIFFLTEQRIVYFKNNRSEVLTGENHIAFAENLLLEFKAFKNKEDRTKTNEINLIVSQPHGLDLTEVEINKTKLSLDLNYNDDFKEIDAIIQNRLNRKKEKGIVLLHGLPGTGKTTYLRYLIGRIKKKVLFVPPDVAANMTNPSFISLLLDNANSVLVIEDAENIILDRKEGGNAAISNLLNIADGLLSDCLNIQIVCSFNIHVSKVDSALLRKGRLIAKYEFGKLNKQKAQILSDSLGFNIVIKDESTLAEIYNQAEKDFEEKRTKIGFGVN